MSRLRWLAGLLAACGWLAGCSTTPPEDVDPDTFKVLTVGNLLSIGVLEHLPAIVGETKTELDLASLYLRGGAASNHWANAQRDGEADRDYRPYRFDRIVRGERTVTAGRRNLAEVLRMTRWNAVVIQHEVTDDWHLRDEDGAGARLVGFIRAQAPEAKIYVQETWSPTPWDRRLKRHAITQEAADARLHAAYSEFAGAHGLGLIPVGQAVAAWRRLLPVRYAENSFGGDLVGGGHLAVRDHFKRTAGNRWEPNGDVGLLNPRGEYLQALVWARALGVELSESAYTPPCVTAAEAKLMREIAAGSK